MNLEKNLRKAESDCKHLLEPQEKALWYDGYGAVITNARILGFRRPFSAIASSDPFQHLETYLSISIQEVIDARFTTKKLDKYFALTFGDEREELLMTLASEEDLDTFKSTLVSAKGQPLQIDFETIDSSNAEARIAQKKNEQKAAKAEAKAAKAEAKASKEAEDIQKYGTVSASAPFGTRWITIYSNGYVKVSSGLGLLKGEIEKLLGIFGESDITKKSGLGRAAGAVFTLGANITLSPNQRGNLYLTIATERETHKILTDY